MISNVRSLEVDPEMYAILADAGRTMFYVPGGGIGIFQPRDIYGARRSMRSRGQALAVQKRRAANRFAAATRSAQRART